MQSMPAFVREMTVRMRTLGLLASAHFKNTADVAIATRNAQAQLAHQHAQLTSAINRQLAAANTFASIARYLRRPRPKPTADCPDIVAAELREQVLALKDCDDPATHALCDRLLHTHQAALGVIAAQRAYLERAISTAQLSIDDERINALHRDPTAVSAFIHAVKDREAHLSAHKSKWNGAGLARQTQRELDEMEYLEQRNVRRHGAIHK